MQLTWLTGAPGRPVSVHRLAVGRCGLGSPATQLMRAVRPPPPGEASIPSWWVVVSAAAWLALAVDFGPKRCEPILLQVSRGPAKGESCRESKRGARVSCRTRLGPSSRRLYTRGVDRSRRRCSCVLAASRANASSCAGRCTRVVGFWPVRRRRERPNDHMQLT